GRIESHVVEVDLADFERAVRQLRMQVRGIACDLRQLIAPFLTESSSRFTQARFGRAQVRTVGESGFDELIELRIAERFPPGCRSRRRGNTVLRHAPERRSR